MACVNPDGTVSASARAILAELDRVSTPERIAAEVGLPLFRVRSSLRELAAAGLVEATEGGHVLTAEGRKRV